MFAGCDSEFIVEAMMPYFLHVVPIVDNTVFDRVSKFKHSLLCLGFLSDIGVLIHAYHDVLVFRSSDD